MVEEGPNFDGAASALVNNFITRRPFLANLVDDDRIYEIAEGILGHDFMFEGSEDHLWVGDTRWHGGAGTLVKWPLPHIKVSLCLEPVSQRHRLHPLHTTLSP
ncbi:MAG: hypothetical protein QGI49_10350 [SAR202 cluster bacterium]|jgi:hypothetical protein|nr:hypothetical protein [SAR202 cluster bacterium]